MYQTRLISSKGAIVFMTASPEGRGYHSLIAETGTRLYKNWGEHPLWPVISQLKFCVFSPNVSRYDVTHFFPESTSFHKDFASLIADLETTFGESPTAGVFPCSLLMLNPTKPAKKSK
jgi:hypothetical protein